MKKNGQLLPSYDHEISKLFLLIGLIIVVTLIVALFFYQDPFQLWQTAFSELGTTTTPQGRPNWASRFVFSAGFGACGVTMFNISWHYEKNHSLRNHTFKRWLAFLGSIGFFVAITPNDINHFVHSLGMGIVVGVIYFFGVIFLLELKSQVSGMLFFTNMTILQMTVLSYAVAFFTNSVYKQSAQKLCIVGLLLVIAKMVMVTPQAFGLNEIVKTIKK